MAHFLCGRFYAKFLYIYFVVLNFNQISCRYRQTKLSEQWSRWASAFRFFLRGDAVNGKKPFCANTSNKQRSAKDPFWFLMLISTKTARKISAVEKSGSLWATVGWVKSRIINKIQQSCASYMSWTLTVQNLWEPLEVILSLSSAALWCPLHCMLGYCDATVCTAFKTDRPYFAFLLLFFFQFEILVGAFVQNERSHINMRFNPFSTLFKEKPDRNIGKLVWSLLVTRCNDGWI